MGGGLLISWGGAHQGVLIGRRGALLIGVVPLIGEGGKCQNKANKMNFGLSHPLPPQIWDLIAGEDWLIWGG